MVAVKNNAEVRRLENPRLRTRENTCNPPIQLKILAELWFTNR
jgi:hypothetical protein